jgi:predicted PurR-regulated permease PerM
MEPLDGDPDPRAATANGGRNCWACTGLFGLALVATLYFGAPLVLPVVLAVLFNFLLSPAVRSLKRIGIPMPIGALLVLLLVMSAVGLVFWQLAAPASGWFERMPRLVQDVQHKLRPLRESVEQVKRATEQVEKAATVGGGTPVREIKVKGPSLLDQLVARAQDVFVGAFMMLVLLYFLMASDDFFLRKVVRVIPRMRDKIRAVEIGRSIEVEIGRYFVSFSIISLGVGIAVTFAMWATGMPNPPLWGAMVAVLNFVPYLGPAISLSVISVVSILTFDTLLLATVPPLAYLAIETVEGNVVQPMTFGRSLSLNPVAIFVSLLFWGWIWGPLGILLAVPILVVLKVAADHIESLRAVAEFLDRK